MKDISNPEIGFKKMSDQNNMDPYKHGLPLHLPIINEIEETLISHVHVVIKTFRLEKFGRKGFNGQVENLQ